MPGINDFKPFATSDSYVIDQTSWANNETIFTDTAGNPHNRESGIVPNSQAIVEIWNKAERQATRFASSVGEYIASNNFDAKDLSSSTLAENFSKAVAAQSKTTLDTLIQTKVQEHVLLAPNADHSSLTPKGSSDNIISEPSAHSIASIEGLSSAIDAINDAIDDLEDTLPMADTNNAGKVYLSANLADTRQDAVLTPYNLGALTLTPAQIPNLSASKITSGQFSDERISSLNFSKLIGATVPAKLPNADRLPYNIPIGQFDAPFPSSCIPPVPLDNINNLDADIFNDYTGTTARPRVAFAEDRIKVSPSKFDTTSEPFDLDVIGNLSFQQMTDRLSADQMPNKLPTDTSVTNRWVLWNQIAGTPMSSNALNNQLAALEDTANFTKAEPSASSTNDAYTSAKAAKAYLDKCVPTILWRNLQGSSTSNTSIANALATRLTKNSPINAGSRPKVTVDSKGLVTAGSVLEVDDLPSIPAEKIVNVTENKVPQTYIFPGRLRTVFTLIPTDAYNLTPGRDYGYDSWSIDDNEIFYCKIIVNMSLNREYQSIIIRSPESDEPSEMWFRILNLSLVESNDYHMMFNALFRNNYTLPVYAVPGSVTYSLDTETKILKVYFKVHASRNQDVITAKDVSLQLVMWRYK